MNREKIGVDIDDVLAEHIPAFVEFSNQRFGTSLTVETYNEDWPMLWRVSYEEMITRAEVFHNESARNYQKIDEANETLNKLAEEYDLVVVTARPEYLADTTHGWVGENFGGIFSETHFVPIWEPGNTLSKGQICQQIGADYLIDDLPRHCNIAAQMGVKALLFGGYEWSKNHHVHEDVERVDTWQEVGKYFDA